jgi:flagellar motor switch protein FliN/FliY
MSDGTLSQDEIDALLNGSGNGEADSGEFVAGDSNAAAEIQKFLSGVTGQYSSSLSGVTGGKVTFSGPQVSQVNRETFLVSLPDTVTTVKADFNSGFPGEHCFVMGEDTAKALAGLMNKEENVTLDDAAMSMLTEAMNQAVGAEITALSNTTGNKTISSVPPQAANVAKAAAALPANEFTTAAWNVDLGDGSTHQIWEIFDQNVTKSITGALSTPSTPPKASETTQSGASGASTGKPYNGPTGGFGQPSSVQSVQFPNLTPALSKQEQTNISLLLDVPMEMTVELGRARKQIKDILSMGEGTIIELDKLAGEPVDILVNRKLIAKGEVVVIDENFGVRVTEIVSPAERVTELT